MKIKILSDSTCDLSPEMIAQYNITLVPLTVIKADVEYKDGVTITPDDIFKHVASGGSLCSTAANSVGEYLEQFQKFAPDYDGVILVTIGSGFSSCYQNACLAATEFKNVRVIDSHNLSTGQGVVVLRACEMSAEGMDLDDIVEQLNDLTPRVETSFVLDRLDYMVKGGRCSSATALGANLLNLKPCIEVRNGKMSVVKKYRGSYSKCLTAYIKDRLAGRADELEHRHLFVTHTPVDPDCLCKVMDVIGEVSCFENIYETHAGCTVSCHCGPSTLGILFVRK